MTRAQSRRTLGVATPSLSASEPVMYEMYTVPCPARNASYPCSPVYDTWSNLHLQFRNQLGYMRSQAFTVPLPAQVRRNDTLAALFQRHLDSLHHLGRCLFMSKVLQHHLRRPDHTDGIGDAFSGNVGGGAMHGLKQGRPFAGGVDVARGRDADGACTGWSEV